MIERGNYGWAAVSQVLSVVVIALYSFILKAHWFAVSFFFPDSCEENVYHVYFLLN